MMRGLLPANIAVVELDIGDEAPGLFPEEESAVRKSIAKRRREFATGRQCARQALAQLGVEACAIPVGEGRAPQWPTGIAGSITHSSGRCAAAVGWAAEFAGIGIDMERNRPISEDVLSLISVPSEREWLAKAGNALPWPALVFGVKECVYKVWYPLTKRWLGFQDVAVTVDQDLSTFRAEIAVESDGPIKVPSRLDGRFAFAGDLLLSAIALPANEVSKR